MHIMTKFRNRKFIIKNNIIKQKLLKKLKERLKFIIFVLFWKCHKTTWDMRKGAV